MSLMEATVDPLPPGSRLDADHPENGGLIPCRITVPPGQLSAAGRKYVLSPGDIERYHRDGFIVAPDVLSEAEVERLRRVTGEFVERARQVAANTDVYDLEDTHSPTEPRVRR